MNNRERYDINVYKRDTWDGISLTMNYTDANGNVTGPMDLTDTNITLQVKINASILIELLVLNAAALTANSFIAFSVNSLALNVFIF